MLRDNSDDVPVDPTYDTFHKYGSTAPWLRLFQQVAKTGALYLVPDRDEGDHTSKVSLTWSSMPPDAYSSHFNRWSKKTSSVRILGKNQGHQLEYGRIDKPDAVSFHHPASRPGWEAG